MHPLFLDVSDVLEIHAHQVKQYGGATGVRDRGLLQSAVASPQATFEGRLLYESIEEMAAVYLYHIVKNHPFIDGNKRTGAVAAYGFLAHNNYVVVAPEKEFCNMVLGVAKGEIEQSEVTRFFRRYARPVK